MTVLALDLGGKTGWAVSDPHGRAVAGYESVRPIPTGDGGRRARWEIFRAWLARQWDERTIREAVYETVPFVSHPFAAQIWAAQIWAGDRAALLIDVTGRQIARPRLPYPIAHGLLERVRPARGASATIYRITAAGEALLARKTDGAQS